MRKAAGLALTALGWLMILAVLLMFAVYSVASDDGLYYQLQSEADVLEAAGISGEDLRILDARLSDGLFAPLNADAAFDNREIEVFGSMQPPFNERELAHLYDCRRLLSPTQPGPLYAVLLLAGVLLILAGRRLRPGIAGPAWLASALILLPIGILGVWAAVDFNAAFTCFHRILFTNELWLLNPETDLLIRICPSSMFANMGLRIGLRSAAALLGVPLLLTILKWISNARKRKINETVEL